MYFASNSDNALVIKAKKKKESKKIINSQGPHVDVSEKVDEVARKIKVLAQEKNKSDQKLKQIEQENIKLKEKLKAKKEEPVKKVRVNETPSSKNSNQSSVREKDNGNVVPDMLSTAMDQLAGTGNYAPDPSSPPEETAVDKIKDQVVGSGEFDTTPEKSGIDIIKDQIIGSDTKD
jgi:hypothetical protein